MTRIFVILTFIICACAGAPPSQLQKRPTATLSSSKVKKSAKGRSKLEIAEALRTIKGPGKVTTPKGAQLDVPPKFTAIQKGNVIDLRAPDRTVSVFLVEIEGSSCSRAVREAWAAVDPKAKWKVHRALRPPSNKGFDEIYLESYVPTKDRHFAQALARRKGKLIWVSLISGAEKELERRNAQIAVFLTSLKAPGVEEIDLSNQTARSLGRPQARHALESFIKNALEVTGTPGLSLAVVEQGKVVLAEGFGVRELGKPGRITADTLMMIGSVTKSMTTLMMATLVDDGKLKWTSNVTAVEPEFKVDDPALTQKLTIENLVCACAGLPRKDLPLILAFAGKTPRDALKELATMRPSTGFKETFQYQNHMVAAGGFISAHVLSPRGRDLGLSYDKAMQERVFTPLEMSSTTLNFDKARRVKNRATPHSQDLDLKHHVVSLELERFASYIRPSGGVWSTSREMARYIIAELNRGVAPNGKRIVSEANLTHRWEPQVKINADASYGLGWGISKYKGLRRISHTGGTMGFGTWVGFFPDKGLGLVMISNGTGGHQVEAVTWKRALELWFDLDAEAQAELDYLIGVQKKEQAQLKSRLAEPGATWIKPLLGRHSNAELGTVIIRSDKKGGYLFKTSKYQTKLLLYRRPEGKKTLIFADPPLAGLELLPLEKKGEGSFVMQRGQEKYVFKISK